MSSFGGAACAGLADRDSSDDSEMSCGASVCAPLRAFPSRGSANNAPAHPCTHRRRANECRVPSPLRLHAASGVGTGRLAKPQTTHLPGITKHTLLKRGRCSTGMLSSETGLYVAERVACIGLLRALQTLFQRL